MWSQLSIGANGRQDFVICGFALDATTHGLAMKVGQLSSAVFALDTRAAYAICFPRSSETNQETHTHWIENL